MEFKKEFFSHLLTLILVMGVLSLWKWGISRLSWSLLFFWLGGLMGTFILDIDSLLQVFWLQPEGEISRRTKEVLKEKGWRQMIFYLSENHRQWEKLSLHTTLFQGILLILAFFVLTSGQSLFGRGMVLMMLWHLLKDQIWDLRKKGRLEQNWFRSFLKKPSLEQERVYVMVMAGAFLLLCLL